MKTTIIVGIIVTTMILVSLGILDIGSHYVEERESRMDHAIELISK
jgi:hypothetical protein